MIKRLTFIAFIFSLIVVVLGAYTRLTDAGLGCPDWPTCYGEAIVPDVIVDASNAPYANQSDLQQKAWIEMIHRYAAGLLGLLIAFIAFYLLRTNRTTRQNKALSIGLLALLVMQVTLGMLTVTELLHPVIVVLHLLGGFGIVALLFDLLLNLNTRQQIPYYATAFPHYLKRLMRLALIVMIIQIALGGWTSSNYAALSCGNFFPTCLGTWLPSGVDFGAALTLSQPLGVNYEYGTLDEGARIAIQLLHRFGALITAILIIGISFLLRGYQSTQTRAITMLALLGAQISLGALNVMLSLPLITAVLHNLIGLLLLLAVISILHIMRYPRAEI